jgi:small subunit ribosomal protein S16
VSVKIRLKRIGNNKKPYFRIVVVDSRFSAKGRRVEDLGTYNPKSADGTVLNFKTEAAVEWIKKGAIPSVSVVTLLEKAGVKL